MADKGVEGEISQDSEQIARPVCHSANPARGGEDTKVIKSLLIGAQPFKGNE